MEKNTRHFTLTFDVDLTGLTEIRDNETVKEMFIEAFNNCFDDFYNLNVTIE